MSIWSSFFVVVFVLRDINSQSCTLCVTPNGERAICQSIYECPTLLNVVEAADTTQIQFLKASQCGYEQGPLVCCGTSDNYESSSVMNPNIPDRKKCGFQASNRINHGEDTDMDEFLWMALLQYRNSSGFVRFACGGTLISSRYVLTAAHCVKIPRTSAAGQFITPCIEITRDFYYGWMKTAGLNFISMSKRKPLTPIHGTAKIVLFQKRKIPENV